MKKVTMKKLVIGVAVGCLLVGGGTFAAGHATSLVTHSFLPDVYRNYNDLPQAQQKLGYATDAVEEFSNGYRFREMMVEDVQGQDEGGNAVYTYPQLGVVFEKQGEARLWLTACKPVEAQTRDKAPDATRTVGDIMLYYDVYNYKFVPPNYELTEADKANLENPAFQLSYGTEEVQTKTAFHVMWEKDGVTYLFTGFDLNLSADDMFDMAEEVIGTK